MLVLALLLAGGLPLPRATLLGWTPDGQSIALEGMAQSLEKHGKASVGEARFVILADPSGTVRKVLRKERGELVSGQPRFTLPAPIEQLWRQSADAVGFDRGELRLEGREAREGVDEPLDVSHGGVSFRVRFDPSQGSGCRVARFVASVGAISALLAEDRCAPGDGGELQNDLESAWSPDGRRVALLWSVLRWKDGENEITERSYLAVASARGLASVDLLDAGGGAQAQERLSESLAQAGFRVAHKGKAVAQRTATVVYFAAGFEAEAKEVARLSGGSPQPLAFKSPYALTVALARGQ